MTVGEGLGGTGRDYPSQAKATFTLVLLVAAYMVAFLDRQILSLLVDPIRLDLGVGDFEMGLLQGLAFALFFSILGIPAGLIADRFNRKRLIIAGILLWTAMTIGCGLASSFAALFLFRMGVGIGEAVLAPAGYSMLSDCFPPERLMRATSTFALGGHLGAGLAMLFGGQVALAATGFQLSVGLDSFQPWQVTFMLVASPGFIVALLLLAITEPYRRGQRNGIMKATVQSSLSELRADWRAYAPFYSSAVLLASVGYAGLAWFPTHLLRRFGWSIADVGMALGSIQIGAATLGTAAGIAFVTALHRRGHTDAYLRGIMITSILSLPFIAAPLVPDVRLALFCWTGLVFVQSCYYGSATAALQRLTPPHLRGLNTGVFLMTVNLGGMGLGTALVGLLSDKIYGGPGGLGAALATVSFAAMILAALVAGLCLGSHARRMDLLPD